MPTPNQAQDLMATLMAFADACNLALEAARKTGKKRPFPCQLKQTAPAARLLVAAGHTHQHVRGEAKS
jgi:hypothetical protein